MKKVYTNGRPAWYDTDGTPRTPFVVGVAGGSASGKSKNDQCNFASFQFNFHNSLLFCVCVSIDTF
jgi:hypothetical protein